MARLDGGEFVLLLEGNPDTTDTARIAQSTINAYAFFEPHMHASVREQIELQHDLRLVIDRNSLSLHYQPKASTSRSAVTGGRRCYAGNIPRAACWVRAFLLRWPSVLV